jgi:hypothetical protein
MQTMAPEDIDKLSAAEIVDMLNGDNPLNRARRQFSAWRGKIEQAGQQRQPYSPVTMRRDEFKAVLAIVKELGIEL